MSRLLVMGCDPHLDTVAAAVVDGSGGEVMSVTVPNTQPGWDDLIGVCRDHGIRRVGIEGASGYGRRLAQTLCGVGIVVEEIPTRVTARTRRIDGAGKTDPGDARTIGRAVVRGAGHRWADAPQLETLRVLTGRREHLVRAQTADINQLRALMAEIDPELAATTQRIRSRCSLETLTLIAASGDPHRDTVVGIIGDIATECLSRLVTIKDLERRIETVMPPVGHALIEEFQGCGVIVAAQLLSQLAGTEPFTSDAKLAAWAGTAPLDVSSGRQQRHRLNPRGNRQFNRAIHTIVVTQHRLGGEANNYITDKTRQGKTKKEAIRALKRHLTRRIWKTLKRHQLT